MSDGRNRDELSLRVESAESPVSLALQEAFFADISTRYPGWTPSSSQSFDSAALDAPSGVWVVAYLDGRPVGCGGLQARGPETAEIRRIFLDERARGHGIGRALLTELETHARRIGYRRVRLTTGDLQPEALGLFRSAGFEEIPKFTDGVFTRHWMEKALSDS